MAATTVRKGNLTKAPKDFPQGENKNGAWVKVTLAENRRDRDGNELDPHFHEIWIYGYEAEHFLNSDLDKGVRCFAEVRLGEEDITILTNKGDEFETTRTTYTAIEFGPSTRWNPVAAHKEKREGGKAGSTGTSRRAKSKQAEEDDAADEAGEEEEKPKARSSRSRRSSRSGF